MLRRWIGGGGAVVALLLVTTPARALTAMEMVERALAQTQRVADYTAKVTVTVQAPNLQMPPRTVKVYYKRPDKVHVESEGIVVLPRDALLMGNLAGHLGEHTIATFNGSGTLGGRPVQCVKLTPRDAGPGTGRVLTWIDRERSLLLKSEVWRGGAKMLTVSFAHTLVAGRYWMPAHIVTEVARGAIRGDDEGGRIELRFSNYRINTGLPDSIFEESR